MKKKSILIIFTLLVIASQVFGQRVISEEKNVIKTNVLSLLVGTGTVSYEREITNNLSGNLNVGYLNYTLLETSFSGLILTPEVRYYPKENAIDGFYIAPYFRYQNYKLGLDENNEAKYSNYGGGVSFGNQWITNSGFTIDVFFGGHYGKGVIDVDTEYDSTTSSLFEGFKIRIGFMLGFAF